MAKLFALLPAAGIGVRMGGALPKQYLPMAGRPLLYHAMNGLHRQPQIERLFVVLASTDTYFVQYDWRPFDTRITPLYCGGETRAASVLNGLLAAHDTIAADDWVLVHDAVRPCLAFSTLERLIDVVAREESGGLLALPLVDTLKRGDIDNYVIRTETREHLWQAQTPQMFRYRLLVEALQNVEPAFATDEACAIEKLGLRPKLVMGDSRNLKITYAHDLSLAEIVLKSIQESS